MKAGASIMNKTRFFTLVFILLLVLSVGMAVFASASPDVIGETAKGIAISEGSGDADISEVEEGSAAEAASTKTGGNTPLFIGAGLAVLMFAGVAVYCKTHGKKTLYRALQSALGLE
jgi:hypothetical protein